MGMTGWQRFWRVELPLALPLIVSGLRLALVQVWATATIAALVAGPGLGTLITEGFYRTDYPKGIAGGVRGRGRRVRAGGGQRPRSSGRWTRIVREPQPGTVRPGLA